MTLTEELRNKAFEEWYGIHAILLSTAADRIEDLEKRLAVLEKRVAVLENDRGFDRDGFVRRDAPAPHEPQALVWRKL